MSVPGTAADAPISCSDAISTVTGTGPRARSALKNATPDRRAHTDPGRWAGTFNIGLSTFDLNLVPQQGRNGTVRFEVEGRRTVHNLDLTAHLHHRLAETIDNMTELLNLSTAVDARTDRMG